MRLHRAVVAVIVDVVPAGGDGADVVHDEVDDLENEFGGGENGSRSMVVVVTALIKSDK